MRILFATENYHPNVNGESVFIQRLAENLAKRGHVIAVVSPSRSFRNERGERHGVMTIGFRSFPLFIQGFRASLPGSVQRNMRKVLRDFSPDVIHIQDHFAIGAAAVHSARSLGIPVLATNHFLPENLLHYLHLPSIGEAVAKKIAWKHFCSVYNHADRVTTPTATAAAHLRHIGFKKEVLPVSCGIDLKRFHPGERDRALCQKYLLPEKPLLLCVGRLDKEKNIDLVLRAVHHARKTLDIHLVLAGKGHEAAALKALAKDLKITEAVSFLGYIPDEDLPRLYRSVQCFLSAGIAELQSIATLEAMASGLPVIAVNTLALPELVKDGRNGFLFAPGDVAALETSIERIFSDDDLRRHMAEESLSIVQSHAIEKSLAQFEALYASLVARR